MCDSSSPLSELRAAPGSVPGSGVRPGEAAGVGLQQSLTGLQCLLCSKGTSLLLCHSTAAVRVSCSDPVCVSAREHVQLHPEPACDSGPAASSPGPAEEDGPDGSGSDRVAVLQTERKIRHIQQVHSINCSQTLLGSAAPAES